MYHRFGLLERGDLLQVGEAVGQRICIGKPDEAQLQRRAAVAEVALQQDANRMERTAYISQDSWRPPTTW